MQGDQIIISLIKYGGLQYDKRGFSSLAYVDTGM